MCDRSRHGDLALEYYHAWRGEPEAGPYADVPGFCKAATLEEIAAHGFV